MNTNRIIALLFFMSGFLGIQAQKNFQSVRITYESSYHGKIDSAYNGILEITGAQAKISYHDSENHPDAPSQFIYLDFNTNELLRYAILKNGEKVYTTRSFKINDRLTLLDEESEIIAGYRCKKAETVINSNTLEIWYTTELGVRGSVQPGIGIPDGLVLKIIRNGQSEEKAVKIELFDEKTDLSPDLTGTEISAVDFNYKIQQSLVVSVDVFDHQSIYFRDIPAQEQLNETEIMQFANGSIILRKVILPENNEGYSIFAELSHYSEGDAYDRTGSVFLIPTTRKQSFLDGLMKGKEALPYYIDKYGNSYEGMVATDDYFPPLELMRFYTSFGIREFNHIKVAGYHWPDSVIFKQEITDYASWLKNEVWIGVWIGNYSQNGHNVSLKLNYYPGEEATPKTVQPLFATVNIMEMAGQAYPAELFREDSLAVSFKTDTDLKNAYIRYIATGHGGWGGGDEFNPKLNEIFLNGKRIMAYTPWREDCGSYRELNPASGNFYNGLSSSDLSRSGWCPGTVSYPVYLHIGDLKAGIHHIKVAIPVGKPEGNSISYWCISGVLAGESE